MTDIYIVDGARTPFLKSKNRPGPFSACELALAAGEGALAHLPLSFKEIDEVIVGCMMPSENEANIARLIALRLGCQQSTPAWTVQRNCASGMQSLDSACQSIAMGRSHLVLAGGTEVMSRAPLLFKPAMVNWFADLYTKKGTLAKLKHFLKLRPAHFAPIIALLNGLSDPLVKLNMGQTAENIAYHFGIDRHMMDIFSAESHRRVAAAQDSGRLTMVTVCDQQGQVFDHDTGLRRETTVETLSKLPAIFDKKMGQVTAGNSSQVTDGAAMLLLASREAIEKYHLPVLAKIKGVAWAGCDPAEMGLGPVYAVPKLLAAHQLQPSDIAYWEINEAFAAQVLGCLSAWEDEAFCKKELGLEKAFGKIPMDRLNVDGGAIALGHPVGASGARIVLQLAHILQREKGRYGVASLCIGGGQGGALLLERAE